MPSISVVIPTFNRLDLLRRALDSVKTQTRLPDEIIVVDDGSTDSTAQRIGEAYPKVRVLRQAHQGVSAARNRGIAAAKGDWIAFLDSDDTWMPEKLARQEETVRKEPAFPLCHTEEIWIRHGRRVNPLKKHAKAGGWIFEQCLPLCVISPSSAMVKRSLLEDLGGFDETLPACEDYDLWLRICSRFPVHFIETPLVTKYGGHEDQLSRVHWGMDRFRAQSIENLLAAGLLSDAQRAASLQTLIAKLRVLEEGARKRDKREEVRDYARRREEAQRKLDLLPIV